MTAHGWSNNSFLTPMAKLRQSMMRLGFLLLFGPIVSLTAASEPALAQQVARIAAAVDGEPITFMDLEARTRLVVFGAGLPLTDENMNRLMPQILDGLIDETLQRRAAEEQNVTVQDQEIEGALATVEERNSLPPGGLDSFLASKGLDKNTLLTQVRSSIAWAKLVERRLRPQIEIGDDEIDEAIRRIEENQGQPQLLVAEIFLAADDSSDDTRARESALRVVQQIRAGASFEALARALSQNATAASGGDLGWLVEGQFEEEVGRALVAMQPGQIAGPIRTSDGYHIVLLRDRRMPGGADPGKTTVDLRQIGIRLPIEPTRDDLGAAVTAAEAIRARATDCTALPEATQAVNAKVIDVGRVRVADLAKPLQDTVMRLGANQISPPLRAPQAIVMFMVCDREAEAMQLPSREQIRSRIELEKLDLLARRYLRDLRRAAFVDVRL